MVEEENYQTSKELVVAQNVHERLLTRFGSYRTSSWQPSPENVAVLQDEEFENKWVELMGRVLTESVAREGIRDALGFAHFDTKSLYVRASESDGVDLEESLAHEMLHLWFLRDGLIKDERYSHEVNETFIEALAVEGLDLYQTPKEQRSQHLDTAINNTIIVKAVADKMGEEGWKDIFDICQTGDEWKIRKRTKTKFGAQPPTKELRRLNEKIPVIYGKKFWDRFKEVALAMFKIRRNPNFQRENPSVTFTLTLVPEWAGVTAEVEKEI